MQPFLAYKGHFVVWCRSFPSETIWYGLNSMGLNELEEVGYHWDHSSWSKRKEIQTILKRAHFKEKMAKNHNLIGIKLGFDPG